MTALAQRSGLADSLADLFAPVDDGPIAALLAEHVERRAAIERLATVFTATGADAALGYYSTGNAVRDGYTVARMFGPEGCAAAIKALDADYWRRALDATDVLSSMPAKRREEWHKQIHERNVPPFNADTLRATLGEHLGARAKYFAERVDGLFRALSPDHRTNIAAGFRSKMIIAGLTESAFYMGPRLDYLVDLRVVVARFMGRDIDEDSQLRPLTEKLVRYARHYTRGKWVQVDGGAIELRMYGNGNAHIRVHDEIAWRLNAVLASCNPGAIPESNRTRPAYGKKTRTASGASPCLFLRPVPFAVLETLRRYVPDDSRKPVGVWHYSPSYDWPNVDKHVRREVLGLLASIGGVESTDYQRSSGGVVFDFDPTETIGELLASGQVPDQRAHQFYPTPPVLAARVAEVAAVRDNDTVLEPSAGQGALVQALRSDGCDARVICVEASALHCSVLRSRFRSDMSVHVLHVDFLQARGPDFAEHFGVPTCSCVVMNPPFDRGQWRAHVLHAAKFLRPGRGARLVAVLPASAVNTLDPADLPGFTLTWSEPIDNAFTGTGVSVVILKAERV